MTVTTASITSASILGALPQPRILDLSRAGNQKQKLAALLGAQLEGRAQSAWSSPSSKTSASASTTRAIDTQQGLTQTYNKLKDPECTDPEILHLRTFHEDMDAAVLRAYGWPEIQVPPFCPLTAEDQKSLETFQDQVIDHLFVLNAERAKEEARLGAASKKATKPKPAKAKKPKPPPDQGSLF